MKEEANTATSHTQKKLLSLGMFLFRYVTRRQTLLSFVGPVPAVTFLPKSRKDSGFFVCGFFCGIIPSCSCYLEDGVENGFLEWCNVFLNGG